MHSPGFSDSLYGNAVGNMKARRMGSVAYRAMLSTIHIEVLLFPIPEGAFLKNLAINYMGQEIEV